MARAPSEEKQQQQTEQRAAAAARSGGADPLFGADLPLSAIQSTVAKLTLRASSHCHWRDSSSLSRLAVTAL